MQLGPVPLSRWVDFLGARRDTLQAWGQHGVLSRSVARRCNALGIEEDSHISHYGFILCQRTVDLYSVQFFSLQV